MQRSWKALLTGLAGAVAVSLAAASASAQCGDLNSSGGAPTLADLAILADCADGTCNVDTTPCGGTLTAACADIFADGNFNPPDAADLGALGEFLAGGDPLYDLCKGPGANRPCPGGTVTLGSPSPTTISASETWPASCTVRIGGTVFVDTPDGQPTTVLRVAAGSRVVGVPGTTTANPAALIVLRGARVDFQGTQSQPIVFTSEAPVGSRSKGDWGGVMINGASSVNADGCEFAAEGVPEGYGGCIADDDSGIANFVRVEFAGLDFTANNELNLWTMNAVGSQTQFNNIQAHDGDDDCLEWFGGTSNHTNMVASACGDDGFDFQLGYTGAVQFGLVLQNGGETDSGRDSRGIEGDNSEFDNQAETRSNPDFCNLTIIGGDRQAGANDGSDAGILLRRGTDATIANSIVTGFDDAGAELRDVSTTDRACVDANNDGVPESIGSVVIRNSVFFDNGSSAGGTEHPKDNDGTLDTTAGCDVGACAAGGCNCDTESWYNLLVTNFDVENPCGSNAVDPGISAQYPAIDNSGCSGAGTPFGCCTGAGTGTCRQLTVDLQPVTPLANPAPAQCSTINSRFVNTSYIGAIDPNATCTATQCGWLSKPWIDFAID